MPRFFTESEITDEFIIDGENGRHICRSLRMKPGESITLCDGKGTDYLCEIVSAEGSSAFVKLISKAPSHSEPKLNLRLYQGLPKGDKMELIIQKAVELGISSIVPLVSNNCVSDIKGKEQKKLERWNKIALEAAKQCGRGIIPQVLAPQGFREAMGEFDGLKLFFYEGGGEKFGDVMKPGLERAAVFVGPEGGFTPEEAELAVNSGAKKVSLGARILRTETAAITATALCMYAAGDMD